MNLGRYIFPLNELKFEIQLVAMEAFNQMDHTPIRSNGALLSSIPIQRNGGKANHEFAAFEYLTNNNN